MKLLLATRYRKLSRGFTLIELLVVIAIIGLLASFLLPALSRAQHLAREKQCVSNLSQLYLALKMYSNEHDGWYPVEPTEHNPHPGLFKALNVQFDSGMARCFYCPEGSMREASAQDTVHYTPKGASDSVVDTPVNNRAGNIGYVYWSFLNNKPGWRNVAQFKPRLLHDAGPVQSPTGPPIQAYPPTETWILSDWFRQGAPFPHTRGHAQGLNVLYLDGHVKLVFGSPKDNYH
jgi:prepilin-type N-terminal cleavage/methylation domain-containing protein/prepilin-type processing-associated H-X9-DG protein